MSHETKLQTKKDSNWKENATKIGAKTILGASIGIAGGMAMVAGAAAVEGALLSWILFTKVLGIAGAAGGFSHGISSVAEEKKQKRK